MDIDIQRAAADDSVELAVRGRLDAESAGELRQAVAAEVRRGMHLITLDLNGVSFLSSAGIRVLFETQREARGGWWRLPCPFRKRSGAKGARADAARQDPDASCGGCDGAATGGAGRDVRTASRECGLGRASEL